MPHSTGNSAQGAAVAKEDDLHDVTGPFCRYVKLACFNPASPNRPFVLAAALLRNATEVRVQDARSWPLFETAFEHGVAWLGWGRSHQIRHRRVHAPTGPNHHSGTLKNAAGEAESSGVHAGHSETNPFGDTRHVRAHPNGF